MLAIAICCALPVRAQSPAPAASGTASPSVTPNPSPTPTPVPLPYVVSQSEEVTRTLRGIQRSLQEDTVTNHVEVDLPLLTVEISEQANEGRRMLSGTPSLDSIRIMESEWSVLGDDLPSWTRELTLRATELDGDIVRLDQLQATWEKTLAAARQTETPPDVLQRIEQLLTSIRDTRQQVEARRAQVLSLQNRVAEQSTRVGDAQMALRRMRDEAVTLLFVRDSPRLWDMKSYAGDNALVEAASALRGQGTILVGYVQRMGGRFAVYAALLLMLTLFIAWARENVEPMVEEEPALATAQGIFVRPFATAMALSLIFVPLLFPRSPMLLDSIFAGATLLPMVFILRRLVEPQLYPVLNALITFYVIDVVRGLQISVPIVYRWIFFIEVICGIIFLVWLARRALTLCATEPQLWRTVLWASRFFIVTYSATLAAIVMGYMNFARLLGNASLESAYSAMILYSLVRILESLAIFAMRVRPLVLLGMVSRHQRSLRRRLHKFLVFTASLIWVVIALELLAVRAPLVDCLEAVLGARAQIGSAHISLGAAIQFGLVVWASFFVSGLLRFILEEDVYPRLPLARGVPYAISTLLHYSVLLFGFFLALAALNIDMTKFTILAGAFGVGLGFGLQNIVNNFVSGLILLFERPVKVGDSVELRTFSGSLRQIGLRASVLQAYDGSEVIVPNGTLISQEVVNWTLTDQRRRIDIDIGVEYGCDPQRVVEVLLAVARAHEQVLVTPVPQALFMNFGDSALNFQLRAWTAHFEGWQRVRSELNLAIVAAMREASIEIPFPQRDVNLRVVGPTSLLPP